MKPKVIFAKDKLDAAEIAKRLLYERSNFQTALFLSGGSTPSVLYKNLAAEKKLKVGAVAMVDERFGKKLHENSNEKMILESGLISFLKKKKIPFYPILTSENKSIIEKTTKGYEDVVKKLFEVYEYKIGILGIGEDGHTAGLPARGKSEELGVKSQELVTYFDNFPGEFPKRITLNFPALSKLDLIIILALGEDKKKAIKNMFKKGEVEQIPTRFFLEKGIAEKTILVTDQNYLS